MKYRDIITVILFVVFFATLAYTLGVNNSFWLIPLMFLILLILFVYKLWIKK